MLKAIRPRAIVSLIYYSNLIDRIKLRWFCGWPPTNRFCHSILILDHDSISVSRRLDVVVSDDGGLHWERAQPIFQTYRSG